MTFPRPCGWSLGSKPETSLPSLGNVTLLSVCPLGLPTSPHTVGGSHLTSEDTQ